MPLTLIAPFGVMPTLTCIVLCFLSLVHMMAFSFKLWGRSIQFSIPPVVHRCWQSSRAFGRFWRITFFDGQNIIARRVAASIFTQVMIIWETCADEMPHLPNSNSVMTAMRNFISTSNNSSCSDVRRFGPESSWIYGHYHIRPSCALSVPHVQRHWENYQKFI